MSLMETMSIGEKSLEAHGARIKIHAKNIANIDTPNYVRKIPVLNATDDISFHGLLNSMKEDVFGVGTIPFQQGGVKLTGVVEDPTPGERIYKPGHPDADANVAQRAYEANLAVINITKSMAQRAVEIGK